MDQKIIDHLRKYNQAHGWNCGGEGWLYETLSEADEVYSEYQCSHRWWDDWWVVVEIDGKFIGFVDARANRDEHCRDLGWEFEEESICEAIRVAETVVKYIPEDQSRGS